MNRALPTLALLAACGVADPIAATAGRTTPLCAGISGMEAIAWESYAGVVVVDAVLPPPAPLGAVYSHPDLPLLGFTYATGWTPETLRGINVIGVNLVRDDGNALWRYISAPANGPITPGEVLDIEIASTRASMGLNGEGTVVCRFDPPAGEVSEGTGITADVHNLLLRIDDHSMIVAASVINTGPTLPPSVFVRKMVAPTAEFQTRLYDTFLAIDWQLLYGGGRNENDRDGDGIWDVFDKFPDDPQRN